MSRRKLMIPGPVDVPEDVRQAMSVASMPHYGPEWLQLYGETQEMLRQVLKTRAELCVVSGPGTLAMEIGLASTLERGDAVIIPTNGFFSDRLVAVAESHDFVPIIVRVEPGLPVLAEVVTSSLEATLRQRLWRWFTMKRPPVSSIHSNPSQPLSASSGSC